MGWGFAVPLAVIFSLPADTLAQWWALAWKRGAPEVSIVSDHDRLPEGALARLGSLRLQHMAPDHDSTMEAALAAMYGRQLQQSASVQFQFSKDGKHLFSAGTDNRFSVWATKDGREVRFFSKEGLTFSPRLPPDPNEARNVQMMQMQLGRMRNRMYFTPGAQSCTFAISPDGQTLACLAGSNKIDFWDTAGGTLRQSLQAKHPLSCAFAPNGKTFVLAERTADGQALVTLWDWTTAKKLHELKLSPRHGFQSARLLFSADGKVLAAATDQSSIFIWNVATGKRIRSYQHIHTTDFALSAHGNLLAIAAHYQLEVYETDSDEEVADLPQNHQEILTAVAISPQDPNLVATASATKIVLRNWRTQKEVRQWPLSGVHESLTFSPDGKQLGAVSASGRIRLWDTATGKDVIENRMPQVGTISMEADGKMFGVEPENGAAMLFEEKGGTWQRQVLGGVASKTDPNNPLYLGDQVLGVHARSKTLAVGPGDMGFQRRNNQDQGGAKLNLIDAKTGRTVASVGAPSGITALAFSHDGAHCAFAEADPTEELIRIIKTKGGKEVRRWAAGGVKRLVYSPDGQTLAALDESNRITIWEVASAQPRNDFAVTASQINALEFSPNGRWLAAGCEDETVRLWDSWKGTFLRAFVGHHKPVHALAFSPDGRILASGAGDGLIRLWMAGDGKDLGRFDGHRGGINCLTFSESGKRLVSCAKDGTVVIWDATKPSTPRMVAEHRLPDSLLEELGRDAATAQRAAAQLTSRPEVAVTFLRAKLAPASTVKSEQIDALIRELDDEKYAVREKGAKLLEQLDTQAEAQLLKALAAGPGPELSKRLQGLIDKLEGPVRDSDRLRRQRAIEVLEQIGTTEAAEVLLELSKGAPGARLTRLAEAARQRLAQRQAGGK